jgi:hypothetical protein
METVRQQDYIISYDYAHPISNGRINEVFEWFYLSAQLEIRNYPDTLYNLSHNIIRLFNERLTTVDSQDYIETSRTLWLKLKSFQSERDLYMDTLSDELKESNLISIYEQHNSKDINDTVSKLKDKKQIIIEFFENIVELYTDILTRTESHKDNKRFHFKAYTNKIIKKLDSVLVQKQIVLDSFDIAIENIREKNHRRAVMIQCMKQNFGYSNLSPIENALIYNIDSYIH